MSDAKLRLPQQDGGLFLTDGGIETVLIFQEGIALPEFAAFVLLESKEGRTSLRRYFRRYLELAAATPEAGFVLESPTWRAGVDWGAKLGFGEAAMRRINRNAISLMRALESEYAGRVADYLEFAELLALDALERNESCGGHFREEYQTPDGEAQRDDEHFSHVAAWEFTGVGSRPVRHVEPLTFEYVKPTQRSYK